MDRNIPLPGSFYKYTDGNILQIICIAKNYKDEEMEVVYQKMFPPFDIWTEPLDSFMGKAYSSGNVKAGTGSMPASVIQESASIDDDVFKEALLNGTIDRKISGSMPDSEIAEKGFMELLDANNYHEKYIIFTSLRKYLDKRLLSNIAVALDIVLEAWDEEEQYDSILHCLQTFEHYETQRLR